jgi:stearoyl-CoA desaturase (delta-9 desaturase)
MDTTTRGFNWGPAIFLVTYHFLLLIGLPLYLWHHTPSLGIIIATIVLLFITGISITGGYHRYFSHKTYRAHKIIELFLLFFGTMTAQGSVLRWAFDHRNHHALVDTDEDPYSIKKGFWYAHFLWIMEKPRKIEANVVSDLMKNSYVMFQHHYYPYLLVISNLITTLFLGWIFNDYLGAFILTWWTRLFFLHHFTWFINSLAHTWGDKPFSEEQSAVDNYIISLLTFGEGYHNYHHTYANDYRNGIRWYHFDPTKWFIWALSKVGLTTNLKRMDPFTIKKRLVMERKNLLTAQVKDLWHGKKDELEKNIHEISDRILAKIADFKSLKEQYYQNENFHDSRVIKNQLKELKKSLRNDWRSWNQLSKRILSLQSSIG